MRQKRSALYPSVWQGVVGNYGVLIFFSFHLVDELQNQKCGTHIKKLTAMKFQNLKKLSYGSNKLGKVYLKKKLKLGQSSKIELSCNFFYFFIFLKNNFFVFKNVENLIADSKRQYPTFYKQVLTDSS